MTTVYLELGSNLGDRGGQIQKALVLLERWGVKIIRSSKLYEAEPFGHKDQPWFLNMAVKAETALDPGDLLKAVKSVEDALGRQKTFKWGPRKIDIDILFYGIKVIDMPGLQIPHPGIAERNFVLVPLAEIAPELVHPVLKKSAEQLLKECSDEAIVRPL